MGAGEFPYDRLPIVLNQKSEVRLLSRTSQGGQTLSIHKRAAVSHERESRLTRVWYQGVVFRAPTGTGKAGEFGGRWREKSGDWRQTDQTSRRRTLKGRTNLAGGASNWVAGQLPYILWTLTQFEGSATRAAGARGVCCESPWRRISTRRNLDPLQAMRIKASP